MTIKRRWMLTILGFAVITVALLIAVSTAISFYGAKRGAFEWLRGSRTNGVEAYNRFVFDRLRDDARALVSHPEMPSELESGDISRIAAVIAHAFPTRRATDDAWILVAPDGRIQSDVLDCTREEGLGARLDEIGDRGYVACGDITLMVARATTDHERPYHFYFGRWLGDGYADELKAVTGVEHEIWSRTVLLGTTYVDVDGNRLSTGLVGPRPPESTEPATRFERAKLRMPRYAGYQTMLQTDLAAGTHDAFVLIGPLDSIPGRDMPVMVSGVPSEMMTMGAYYSMFAMIGLGVILLAAIAVVASRLVRSFVRPLEQVEGTARRIAAGERAEAVPVQGDREVASLAASFNWMIEELHKAQESALQAGKMAAVGQLAAGVAHEVNNPLGVILGFAQGLERRVPEGDKLRLPVTSIVREAVRCRNLVQELLTFSRAGKKTSEVLDVREVIASTLVLLEARARTQKVAIMTDFRDVPRVNANPVQLQQVIVNLATNAFDAMSDGGTLTLRTRASERGTVVIEVADTGTGIPDDIRGRIFEPFFTTKEVGKGTGLGLSLVYEILRHADGTIEVESAVGKGTTMAIHLPPAAPAAVAA